MCNKKQKRDEGSLQLWMPCRLSLRLGSRSLLIRPLRLSQSLYYSCLLDVWNGKMVDRKFREALTGIKVNIDPVSIENWDRKSPCWSYRCSNGPVSMCIAHFQYCYRFKQIKEIYFFSAIWSYQAAVFWRKLWAVGFDDTGLGDAAETEWQEF